MIHEELQRTEKLAAQVSRKLQQLEQDNKALVEESCFLGYQHEV